MQRLTTFTLAFCPVSLCFGFSLPLLFVPRSFSACLNIFGWFYEGLIIFVILVRGSRDVDVGLLLERFWNVFRHAGLIFVGIFMQRVLYPTSYKMGTTDVGYDSNFSAATISYLRTSFYHARSVLFKFDGVQFKLKILYEIILVELVCTFWHYIYVLYQVRRNCYRIIKFNYLTVCLFEKSCFRQSWYQYSSGIMIKQYNESKLYI